jgi:predicted dithiol-disulfide oxidoreductase (DUF899 family)
VVTLEQQLRCAQNELARRRRVLPSRMDEGKAAYEIDAMAAIEQTLLDLYGEHKND